MAGGKSAILSVKVLGESKDAQMALLEVEASVEMVDNTTKKSGKKMMGVWSAVAGSILACVRASGQLESATNALNVVYGESADSMLSWAEGMAQYGLSTAQAAQAAAVLGAQLQNFGFTTDQAVVASQALIETATQLAIVMGGSATEAVQAMGAAMRGEYDTLERFGIALTADSIATEAARLASEGMTFATEAQAKAVATLSLIQQQSTAILDGATEGYVNQETAVNHLWASIKNLAATIGDMLTPANGVLIESTASVIDKLNEQIQSSDLLHEASEALVSIMESLQEILDPVLSAALDLISTLADQLAKIIDQYVTPVLEILADVLDTVADALSTVIGWVQEAIQWFDNFTDSVHEAIDALTFWNDTYDPNAATPTEVVEELPQTATATTKKSGKSTNEVSSTTQVFVTEEQVYRAVASLIMRGNARNGRVVMIG